MSEARSDFSDSEEEKKWLRQKAKRDRWAVEVDGRDIAEVRRSIRTLPFSPRYLQEVPLLRSATTITGSWLRHWIGHSFPCPSDAVSPLEDPLQDSIQVLIDVHEFEHTDPSSPWVDPVTFTLQLRFVVPPTSGFLVFVRRSPLFVLATYLGDHEDFKRPDWVDFRYRPTPSFWVPLPCY